jgi:hypothetical protein
MTTRKKPDALGGSKALEGLDSSLLARGRQCTARSKRTGERCKRIVAPGYRTCAMHGSSTKKSKIAAAERIAKASGYAADMLVEFMADPGVDVKLRTQIAQDLLTRANISGKTFLDIEAQTRYEHVVESVLIGLDEYDPYSDPPREITAEVVDAEVVEDPIALERARESEMDEAERTAHHRSKVLDRQRPKSANRSTPPPPTASIEDDPRTREPIANRQDALTKGREAFLVDRLGLNPKKKHRRRTT